MLIYDCCSKDSRPLDVKISANGFRSACRGMGSNSEFTSFSCLGKGLFYSV